MVMAKKVTVVEVVALEEENEVLAIQKAGLEVEIVQMELLSLKSAITTRSNFIPSSHVGN